ncbi:hypothetical protein VM1G_07488 [Cytospora mali]|uniref:Rhodopsin domain-containing protein n=1 Tax=Cytospora mali TaxID=578113 RepID=A0A194W6Z5_CYTMA|nr:hypothetical protein VM1G_07488 [Valsa mali]
MSTATEGTGFTPEEIQYWMAHKNDTLVPNIIACASITGFFSTLFVFLRFVGRRLQSGTAAHFHLSDWLVLAAWVFFVASDVCFALLTPYGGGRHVIAVTNPKMLQVFSILSEAFYGFSMGFLKFSILSLYGSIFPQRKFHFILWGMAVFITGWSLTAFLGAILQCIPIEKAYESSLDGYCISYGKLSLAVTVCNVITDFFIIVLPIPLVKKLHTTTKKKTVIIATFAAGCSAVIASIVRLVYSLNVGSVDGSWTAIPAGYTSCVELTVGFLVVSIPAYRSLFMKKLNLGNGSTIWSWRTSGRGALLRNNHSAYNSSGYNKSSRKGSATTGPHDAYRTTSTKELNRGSNEDNMGYTTTVAAADSEVPKLPGSVINVTDQVELVRMAKSNGAWVSMPDEEMAMMPRREI